MSIKRVVISDVSGKELTDYITVTVEKPDHTIEFPAGHFTNRLQLDIEADRIGDILKGVKFVKSKLPFSPAGTRITEFHES